MDEAPSTVERGADASTVIVQVGRVFFALALVGLGASHFIFGEFVTGRPPPWPAQVPGGRAWAYVTGAGIALVGIAVLLRRRARLAALLGASLIFGWALLRHIPVLLGDSLFAPSWTTAGKALVLVGGALAVATTFPQIGRGSGPSAGAGDVDRLFVTFCRIGLGLFLVTTGVQHYLYTEFVASLIPDWFPGDPVFWTYFAGVALVAGGIGLQIPATARLAALLSGVMVFSWFWIVHVPRTFASVSDGIAVFEALGVAGIAFVLAGTIRRRPAA